MIINTLGPKYTDSYRIALKLINKSIDKINLFNSFDNLIMKINDLKGQYILIPTAYKSTDKEYDWKDFNFEYSNELNLTKVFAHKTKPIMLIENTNFVINKAVIQPATSIFMKNYCYKQKLDLEIIFKPSKYAAFIYFKKYKFRYTIVSNDFKGVSDFKLCRMFYPNMVWCLYEVIK